MWMTSESSQVRKIDFDRRRAWYKEELLVSFVSSFIMMFYIESKYNIKIDGGNSMVARQVA